MSLLLKLCGGALIAAVCAFVLKATGRSIAPIVVALTSLALISGAFLRLSGAVETINGLLESGGAKECAVLMIKALGIGITVNTVGGICTDLGEASLAAVLETVGRVEILILALPLITEILSAVRELLI